jgi:predicted GNAT family acetyltransferase
VYVKSLERCHAPIVYEHWPWKTWTTVDQVANEIDQQPSGGVFLKQNDQLVSWVMGYVPNGLSRLNTLEHHRRRGFAALAIKYMAKRMAQYGCPPFGDVLVGNEASRKLFESLGFRKTQPAHHFSKFP